LFANGKVVMKLVMATIEGRVNKYQLVLELKERDGLDCGICGLSLAKEWDMYIAWLNNPRSKSLKRKACNFTIDHKVPRGVLRRSPDFVYKKGWQWRDKDNLQLAHFTCNNEKADKCVN
jgi:hypothetical protein